jgi:DNA-binding response OmpR family regulator
MCDTLSLHDALPIYANTILTKEQIINHVWDYNSDVLPNTVEVYIRNLRGKIGEDLIQTIRGFGYKIGKD